jgi:hypothetical protein
MASCSRIIAVSLTFFAFLLGSVTGQQGFVRPAHPEEWFPCQGQTATQYKAQGIPLVELSRERKLELLYRLGGTYNPLFMRTRDEAVQVETSVRDALGLDQHASLKNGGARVNASAPQEYFNANNYDACFLRAQPYSVDSSNNYQYRRMCTVCSGVHYARDTFPDYFYESLCHETDTECLYDDNEPKKAHGVCQQINISVTVLKKNPQACKLEFSDDVVIMTEVWDLGYENISVGCECAIKRDSVFT